MSTPAVGFASVTCTCQRAGTTVCTGQVVPASVGRRQGQACSLFDRAAGTTDHRQELRRLRKAIKDLKAAIKAASRAGKGGKISTDCASALKGELRDAKDRAERLLTTLASPPR